MVNEPAQPEQLSDAEPATVDINYLKATDFREIACDGALGGPTPQGKLWVAFYTERYPLPRIVRHQIITKHEDRFELEPDGKAIEGRQGVVRNVEFGVYLSVESATRLRDWLNNQIEVIGGTQ